MTTAVTVDAHAGWPVQVTLIDRSPDDFTQREIVQVVAAGTRQTFYVYDVRDIHVREMRREESAG